MLKPFSDRVSGLQPSAIREILKFTADPEVISFAAGNPAPEAFPVEIIAKLSADIFREEPINALQYSITEGYPKLREWLKADLINLCDRHLHAFLILGKTGTDPVEIALGLLHQILVFFFRIISGIRIV